MQTDTVRVYNADLQLNLGDDAAGLSTLPFGDSSSMAAPAGRMPQPPLSPGPPLRGYAAAPLETARSSPADLARAREAEYQQTMQSILERSKDRSRARDQDDDLRMERLLKHIEHEQEFVEGLGKDLELRARMRERRRGELYKAWREKVYNTIQGQIDEQLAQLRTEDITERRRQLMEDYIRVSAQKRYGLYLDVIVEDEYDPRDAHQHTLKYRASDATDPLKMELIKAAQGNIGKPKFPVGRETLSPMFWDKLSTTPYGRFNRILPPPLPPDPNSMQFSRVPFEHYNVERGREALDREFPRGKRVFLHQDVRDQRESTVFSH